MNEFWWCQSQIRVWCVVTSTPFRVCSEPAWQSSGYWFQSLDFSTLHLWRDRSSISTEVHTRPSVCQLTCHSLFVLWPHTMCWPILTVWLAIENPKVSIWIVWFTQPAVMSLEMCAVPLDELVLHWLLLKIFHWKNLAAKTRWFFPSRCHMCECVNSSPECYGLLASVLWFKDLLPQQIACFNGGIYHRHCS